MLCVHGLSRPSFSPLELYWPLCSLRSEVRPLLFQRNLLQRNLPQLHCGLETMEELHQELLKVTEPFSEAVDVTPVSCQLQGEGENFALTLDAAGFSPEELCVQQEGSKLRVSGRTEKKQEDESGCFSLTRREFRREFELPEGLNPRKVTCCLTSDGMLHIQAAQDPSETEAERDLAMERCSEEATQPSVCSHTHDSGTETDSSTNKSSQGEPGDIN